MNTETINETIVRQFGLLFSAGELQDGQEIAESVVDSSEIINTLSGGGISTVGYAESAVEEPARQGLLSRLQSDSSNEDSFDNTDTTNRITSLVRKATLGRLTLPCEVQGTERVLLVVGGAGPLLNRKGIERSRKWLEEQTGSMEVRGGDFPRRGSGVVAAVVLLAGVTNVPRVKQLQQVAIEAQQNIDEIRTESEENQADLLGTDNELESLY